MNLSDFITSDLVNANYCYCSPHIPEKKLTNAINAYGNFLNSDDVIILLDESMLGSAKSGVLVTNNDLVLKEDLEKVKIFKLKDVSSIEVKKKMLGLSSTLYINDKKVMSFTQSGYKDLCCFVECLTNYLKYLNHPAS